MTDTKNHSGRQNGSLEGRVFKPASFDEVAEAVDLAFDYRGDVTLSLKSGESLCGYIFNRRVDGSESCLELFSVENPNAIVVRFGEIAAIAFTGEDTASGKSWEAWMAKKESERKAEATRVATDAKARGYL
jgi:hypothetical protein